MLKHLILLEVVQRYNRPVSLGMLITETHMSVAELYRCLDKLVEADLVTLMDHTTVTNHHEQMISLNQQP